MCFLSVSRYGGDLCKFSYFLDFRFLLKIIKIMKVSSTTHQKSVGRALGVLKMIPRVVFLLGDVLKASFGWMNDVLRSKHDFWPEKQTWLGCETRIFMFSKFQFLVFWGRHRMRLDLRMSIAGRKLLYVLKKLVLWMIYFSIRILAPMSYLKLWTFDLTFCTYFCTLV